MVYDFHQDFTVKQNLADSAWHSSHDNVEFTDHGLRLWCRGGVGAYVMREQPFVLGTARVRCRISGPTDRPTTKVCLLLWPDGGTPWPPEIDFNESGLRTESHQTLHYGVVDPVTHKHPEHHVKFLVDQTKWHTYAVNVMQGYVEVSCDGVVRSQFVQDVPIGQAYNLHIRTDPHDSSDVTALDVRSVAIFPEVGP